MSFAWDGRRLADPDALADYLHTLPRPTWCRAVVIHHTAVPTLDQWRGQRTMDALRKYYKDEVQWLDPKGVVQRGWSAGPHLFLAPDGLWVGTPPMTVGVHAGNWNRWSIGVEVVGDYNRVPWSEPTRQRVLATTVALFTWLGIRQANLDTLRGHRECGSPKTCPGSAIDMDQVRAWVQQALTQQHQRYRVSSPDGWAAVRIAPDAKAPKALGDTATLQNGTTVLIDGFNGQWAHLSRENPMRDLGFVHRSLLVAAE